MSTILESNNVFVYFTAGNVICVCGIAQEQAIGS